MKFGAHSLALGTKKKKGCENFEIKTRLKWQVHKHFIDKPHVHVEQCMCLLQMKSTLGHEFILGSLHSHGLDLRQGHHLSHNNIFPD